MPYTPRPRVAALWCRLLGHEPRPLTYQEWVDDLPNQEGRYIEVEYPGAYRCYICGAVEYPGDPTDKKLAAIAGARSIKGLDDEKLPPRGESKKSEFLARAWGDNKHQTVWPRHDFNDPPSHNRLEFENRLPGRYRLPGGGRDKMTVRTLAFMLLMALGVWVMALNLVS